MVVMSMLDSRTEQFGERLMLLIKANNLTQSAFANNLCVSPSFINSLIKGIKKPGTEILTKIKNNFDVSIDWLLFGDDVSQDTIALDVELFKAIALRIDIIKAALSGNIEALSALESMHPDIKKSLPTDLNLSYLFNGPQICKDADVINTLYNQYLGAAINEKLYQEIITSAVVEIVAKPVDPLLNMGNKK